MSLAAAIDFVFSEYKVEQRNSLFAVLRDAVLKFKIHTHGVGTVFNTVVVADTGEPDDWYLVCLDDCCCFQIQHIGRGGWDVNETQLNHHHNSS